MGKTFVGFGLGPIQCGLFLFEAHASEAFSRFVISEVDRSLVDAVASNGGRLTLNIARKTEVDARELPNVEVYDPAEASGRAALVAAVRDSDEMATALPSVGFYDAGEASPAGVIAEGLSLRKAALPTVIYAAENHNHAAELLSGAIAAHRGADCLSSVEILNTVIGKMSGTITDSRMITRMGLRTIAPGIERAILVEEFNRILISRIHLSGYKRGIGVFAEKDNLLPFEEAKLYGHNAIHAAIAYLADYKGIETIAQAGRDARIMAIARAAFVNESGAALVRRHGRLGDPLFTPEGYREYADDLLDRMVRPTLNDLVARVSRDCARKLGYDDRFFGTMRLALENGIAPRNLALGAAAGVVSLIKRQADEKKRIAHLPKTPGELTRTNLGELLFAIWGAAAGPDAAALVDLTWEGLRALETAI